MGSIAPRLLGMADRGILAMTDDDQSNQRSHRPLALELALQKLGEENSEPTPPAASGERQRFESYPRRGKVTSTILLSGDGYGINYTALDGDWRGEPLKGRSFVARTRTDMEKILKEGQIIEIDWWIGSDYAEVAVVQSEPIKQASAPVKFPAAQPREPARQRLKVGA
jgi:hypothetical protein